MGINGLLPILKPAIKQRTISTFKNKSIGIDGHVWLYQFADVIAEDAFYKRHTTKHVTPFLNKIKNLMKYNIRPVFVFDGDSLPSKSVTNLERKERKDKIKSEINALLKIGNIKRANMLMRQVVSITPDILLPIIEMLKREGIEYMIAPYEGDAQLTYLQRIGHIDYIMTEDSDLIAYGCDKVLYKYKYNKASEYKKSLLNKAKDQFFADNLLQICILSGCDYLSNIKGVGLLTAYKQLMKYGSVKKVVKELSKTKDVPEDYLLDFKRAEITFAEQIVYDPLKKKRFHLSGKTVLENKEYYKFLGEISTKDDEKFALGLHMCRKEGNLNQFGIRVGANQEVAGMKIKMNKIKMKTTNEKIDCNQKKIDENIFVEKGKHPRFFDVEKKD